MNMITVAVCPGPLECQGQTQVKEPLQLLGYWHQYITCRYSTIGMLACWYASIG